MDGVKKGRVVWYNDQQGYGFITPDDGTADVFVHRSSIKTRSFRTLAVGESVEYEVEYQPDGRATATKVTGPNGGDVQGSMTNDRRFLYDNYTNDVILENNDFMGYDNLYARNDYEDEDEDEDEDGDGDGDDNQNLMQIDSYVPYLPTQEELEIEALNPLSNDELDRRIHDIVYAISAVYDLPESDIPNEVGLDEARCLEQLKKDLMKRYGFSEFFVESMLEMLSVPEVWKLVTEFPKLTDQLCIRANTLKTSSEKLKRSLKRQGFKLSIWHKTHTGLVLHDLSLENDLKRTVEYTQGHFMFQSPSSFLPVIALAPQSDDIIVDMFAGNGEKSTYIAAIMKNSGTVHTFGDMVSSQQIYANQLLMGVDTLDVHPCDWKAGKKVLKNISINRVLLDAPCSCTGVYTPDYMYQGVVNDSNVKKKVKLQKRLILDAIDMVTEGGFIVYSTCSLLFEENEYVVNYAIKKRNVEIVRASGLGGRPGLTKYKNEEYPNILERTMRFYPNVHNMTGCFVAKLKKISN